MPGCLMAMARVNRPSVMVYGGTIRAGCRPDRRHVLCFALLYFAQLCLAL